MKLPSVKLPFGRNKPQTAEPPTAKICTFEDMFTYISNSKQEIKKKRKSNADANSDGGADADAGEDGDGDGDVPEDKGEDADSVSSFSSMATMDDNPGTGRIMDKYFYQPAGRFVEELLARIAFLLHVDREGVIHLPSIVIVPERDGVSLLSVSSTSTATDLPGTGRIIDKYFYQVVGRMIERCAGRIAMSHFLSAYTIYKKINELWYNVEVKEPCFVCKHLENAGPMSVAGRVKMAVERIEDAPSGMFILSGIKELAKRLRSRFLFRRVEASISYDDVSGLDALHFMRDVEEVRNTLEKIKKEDIEKLFLRLSKRAEKLRKKGKELPQRQREVLDVIGAEFDDRLFLSGKPRTGKDLLPLLLEVITQESQTTEKTCMPTNALVRVMIHQSLLQFPLYLSSHVPCQKLTEELEGLYHVLAYYSTVTSPSFFRGHYEISKKRRDLFGTFWPYVRCIVATIMASYAVPGCRECGLPSPVKQCLCLDRIVVLWCIVYLFMADETCVYEDVLRDATNLFQDLFAISYDITETTLGLSYSQQIDTISKLFHHVSMLNGIFNVGWSVAKLWVTDLIEYQTPEHGTRYLKELAMYNDFWDENRLRILRDARRGRQHGHIDAGTLEPLLERLLWIAKDIQGKIARGEEPP